MSFFSLHDLVVASPILILSVGSLMLLMIDVFRGSKAWPVAEFSILVLLAAVVALGTFEAPFRSGSVAFGGFIYADIFSWFFSLLLLAGSMLGILIGMNSLADEGVESPGEYYCLYLMATVGALVLATSGELITLFLGLETMSMALYCLCGSALRYRRSAESAVKYFLLGSFSSAIMLYGIALLFGLTGTTIISQVSEVLATSDTVMAHCAIALILIGFIFKIGAVPFHFWAPDVYQGAPTPVTAYMACVIKASAVAAALRVMWSGFGGQVLFWSGTIWYVAVLTMVLGNLIALRQRSLKRLLAYSSIAHAGYILVGFLARSQQYDGGSAILYYLVVYTVMTMGAFAVVMAATSKLSSEQHPDDISRFNGLAYRNPFLGFAMSVFMLGLAGIPPGMAGLMGKFYIFSAAVKADYLGLAIIGVLCSAVSSYYYLRVIVAIYFKEPQDDMSPAFAPQSVALGGAVTLCVIGVIFLGVFPSFLYDSAYAAMSQF